MKYFFSLIFIFFFFVGQAQNNEDSNSSSKIFFKDGTILVGKILNYDPNTNLELEISGSNVTIASDKIKKIVMMTSSGTLNKSRLKTKRIYNRTNFGLLSNSNGNGISLNHSVLYQHSPLVGVGLSIGIDNYYFAEGRNVYPLLLEFKSFLVDGNSSPFVSLKSGYGFIFTNDEIGQSETKGGLVVNPTFGYRLGSSGVIFDFYMGLRFQSAEYESNNGWQISHQKIQWNRVETGIAFSF